MDDVAFSVLKSMIILFGQVARARAVQDLTLLSEQEKVQTFEVI